MKSFFSLAKLISTTSLLFFSAAVSAVESLDTSSCDEIFTESSDSVTVKDDSLWTVCANDYALAALNLAFIVPYKSDDLIQKHYEELALASPSYDVSNVVVSGLIDAVSRALITIFFVFYVPIFIIMLIFKGVKMAKGEQLVNMFKDADMWKASSMLLLTVILLYPVDEYMLGQTLIVAAAGFGIKMATFLLSSILGVFAFKQEVAEPVSDPTTYLFDGQKFSINLVKESMAAKSMANTLNKLNSQLLVAEVNEDADSLAKINGTSWDTTSGSEFFWNSEEDKSVTLDDYFDNMLAGSTSLVSFSSPIISRPQVSGSGYYSGSTIKTVAPMLNVSSRILSAQTAESKSSAIHGKNFQIKSNSLSGVGKFSALTNDNLLESYYEPENPDGDVFEQVYYSSTSSEVGSANQDLIQSVIDSNMQSQFSSDSRAGVLQSTSINELAGKISTAAVNFAETNASTEKEKTELISQYIKVMRLYLFGLLDPYKTGSISNAKSSSFLYNPLMKDPFESRVGSSVFFKNMQIAHNAANEYINARCTELAFDSKYYQQIVSQVRLMKALDEDSTQSPNSVSKAVSHSGQCFVYTDVPEMLIDSELKTKITELLSQDSAIKDDDIYEGLSSLRGAYADKISAYYGKAKTDTNQLMYYYANVMATINTAGYKATTTDDAVDLTPLRELRENGVASIMGYFTRIASILAKITQSLDSYNSAPSTKVDVSDDMGVTEIDEDALDLVNEKLKDNYIPLMSSIAVYLADGADAPAFSTPQQLSKKEETDSSIEIAKYIIGIVIPDEDVLIDGFGMDSNAELIDNYQACATTANCVHFTQHPILTLMQYGRGLLEKGVIIMAAYGLSQALQAAMDSADEIAEKFGKLANSKVIGNVVSIVGKLGKSTFAIPIAIFSGVMQVLKPFGDLFLALGVLLGFAIGLIPVIGHVMLWLAYILEVVMTFILYPVFLILLQVKINGRSLLDIKKFVGFHVSIIIKPTLFVISFVTFFSLTYVAIFLVNSVTGLVLPTSLNGKVGLNEIIPSIITLVAVIYIYFKIVIRLNDDCLKIPKVALDYIGVEGFNVGGVGELESMMGAGTISGTIGGVASGAGGSGAASLHNKNQMKKRVRAELGKQKKEINKALKNAGYSDDVDTLLNAKSK